MHSAKLAFFRKIVENGIVLSGVNRRRLNGLRMGSPSMLLIRDDVKQDALPNPTKKAKYVKPEQKNPFSNQDDNNLFSCIKDLSEKGKISEVNSLLKEANSIGTLLIPFPQNLDLAPTTTSIKMLDFLYNGTVPIIFDKYLNINTSKTIDSDTFSFKDLVSTAGSIEKILKSFQQKKYRYINISMSDLNDNSLVSVMDRMHRLINVLSKMFPHKASIYAYGHGALTLFDVLSISFYKLEDIIPVFSTKTLNGIGLEIVAFNSLEAKFGNFMNNDSCAEAHMIFSSQEEGVTKIDGERIDNPYFEDPGHEIRVFLDKVAKNTPAVANITDEELEHINNEVVEFNVLKDEGDDAAKQRMKIEIQHENPMINEVFAHNEVFANRVPDLAEEVVGIHNIEHNEAERLRQRGEIAERVMVRHRDGNRGGGFEYRPGEIAQEPVLAAPVLEVINNEEAFVIQEARNHDMEWEIEDDDV